MTDITELMGKDPLKLTKEDRAGIIGFLREGRVRFIQGTKSAGKPPKEVKRKTAEPKGEKLDISDLEIDL